LVGCQKVCVVHKRPVATHPPKVFIQNEWSSGRSEVEPANSDLTITAGIIAVVAMVDII